MKNYDEDELVTRADIAYRKTGGIDQPSKDSDVQEVGGKTYVVLRNINGILAVYEYEKNTLTGLKSWPPVLES